MIRSTRLTRQQDRPLPDVEWTRLPVLLSNDRISEIVLVPEPAECPAGFNLYKLAQRSFGVFHSEREHADVGYGFGVRFPTVPRNSSSILTDRWPWSLMGQWRYASEQAGIPGLLGRPILLVTRSKRWNQMRSCIL